MRKQAFVLFVCCSVAFAATLKQRSSWIKDDLRSFNKQKKKMTLICDDLERSITDFNRDNDRENKSLADEREQLSQIKERLVVLRAQYDRKDDMYSELSGTITAKEMALESLSKGYLDELTRQLTQARKSRNKVSRDKKDSLRLLQDPENFSSLDALNAEYTRYYDLKRQEAELNGRIEALVAQMEKPSPPGHEKLKEEIERLKSDRRVLYTELVMENDRIVAETKKKTDSEKKIKALEKKLYALSNFEIPALCRHF